MNRLVLVVLLLTLGGCATVYDDGYGYYGGDRYGDYYYDDYAPPVASVSVGVGLGGIWYDPYDSLFWGLRYSYFDPFWYPGFYYGVTYFPRYYYPYGHGWPYWYANWYRPWRYHHPYSPYPGSYWDHYYAWHHHRPTRPGRSFRDSVRAVADSPRYGSSRNEAERSIRQRGMDRPLREASWAQARGSGITNDGRQRARTEAGVGRDRHSFRGGDDYSRREIRSLPSRSYAPRAVREPAFGRDAYAAPRPSREWQHPSVVGGRRGPAFNPGVSIDDGPRRVAPSSASSGWPSQRQGRPGPDAGPGRDWRPPPAHQARPAPSFDRPPAFRPTREATSPPRIEHTAPPSRGPSNIRSLGNNARSARER